MLGTNWRNVFLVPEHRARLAWVAALVVTAAGAFSAGRFFSPEKVHTVYEDRVEVRERVVYRDRWHVREVKAKAEVKVVYREKVTKPDGTVTEREAEHTNTKETAEIDTKRETSVDAERTAVRTVTETKTVTLRPDWRLGLTVGVSPFEDWAWVGGAQVDRRIIGGLSVGLWGNTRGMIGLGISFEF